MAGVLTIPTTPRTPATMNQINITGPNMPPIKEVPLRWMRNKMTRMVLLQTSLLTEFRYD